MLPSGWLGEAWPPVQCCWHHSRTHCFSSWLQCTLVGTADCTDKCETNLLLMHCLLPSSNTQNPGNFVVIRNPEVSHCAISWECDALLKCGLLHLPSPAPGKYFPALNILSSGTHQWILVGYLITISHKPASLFPSHWTALELCICLGKFDEYRGMWSILRNLVPVLLRSESNTPQPSLTKHSI